MKKETQAKGKIDKESDFDSSSQSEESGKSGTNSSESINLSSDEEMVEDNQHE